MRAFSVLVAAFLILGPANGAEPLRRRVVQPPRNSACAQAVVVQPIELNWLVLSGDTFFLSDRTFGIKKAPKSGGIPLPVSPKIGLDIPQIAVDETSIYFITVDDATTGSIYSVSKNGGTPKLLATKLAAPIDLALDATSVYWANLGTLMGDDIAADGSIERILKNGTGRQVLADKLSTPSSIALDDADVYFSEVGLGTGNPSAGLRRVSKSGGAVAKLIDDFPLLTVASSGTDVIYTAASCRRPPWSDDCRARRRRLCVRRRRELQRVDRLGSFAGRHAAGLALRRFRQPLHRRRRLRCLLRPRIERAVHAALVERRRPRRRRSFNPQAPDPRIVIR